MPVSRAMTEIRPRVFLHSSRKREITSVIPTLFPTNGNCASTFFTGCGKRVIETFPYSRGVEIDKILRQNVRALMAAASREERPGPKSAVDMDENYGIDKNVAYRIAGKKLKKPGEKEPPYHPGTDKLEALAGAYELPAWALLVEGLDPIKKPICGTQEELEAKAEKLANQMFADAIHERKQLRQKGKPGRPGVHHPFTLGKTKEEKPRSGKAPVRK